MKTENKELECNTEMVINAMNLYIQEYIHRDSHMWSQSYKFYFSALVVTLLPNLTEGLGISLPEKLSNHDYIFPIFGMVLSFVFLYVSLGLAKRFLAISATYNRLVTMLPEELRRISIKDMPMKFLNHSVSYVVIILMFLSLLCIEILCLI